MNEPPIELRIILVGRTGLDARLRLDPGIELVRVRDPLDAIGELADPTGRSPGVQQVVMVAGDAEPDDVGAWVEALRRVDPSARILRVGADRSAVGRWYDEAIAPDASVERLGEVVRRAHPRAADPDEPICQDPPSTRAPEHPPEPAAGPAGGLTQQDGAYNDSALVEAMLHGRDLIEPAIGLIRARLGDPSVAMGAPDGGMTVGGVTVRWRGRVFGSLISDRTDPSQLASHAAWLAGWLRLDEQQRELRQAALTDPLTGAWNRRYFDRFLASALDRARASRRSVTLLVFDIDNFKQYNDRHGHAAGDEILIETVRLMTASVRPTDRVCRIGGDEFAVVFHEPTGPREPGSTPPETVFEISARFQQQIAEHRFPKLGDDAPGSLTISGGLATYPWDGRTPQELLERADELALRSKELGKNAITLGPGAERIRSDERGSA